MEQSYLLSHPPMLTSRIRNFYQARRGELPPAKQFHWYSRLWLWQRDATAADFLRAYRATYIGHSATELREQVCALLENPSVPPLKFGELRAHCAVRYPELFRFNRLLFFMLFSDTLYQTSALQAVHDALSVDELLQYRRALLTQPADLLLLSTHAINYLYLTQHYFPAETAMIDPLSLAVATHPFALESDARHLHLYLYLLTHCIINASRFYAAPLRDELPRYQQLLALAEQLITRHYESLSLDIKFEFLVCAALCATTSVLEGRIKADAAWALSPHGDFLIEPQEPERAMNFAQAEHRNVLYLMLSKPFHYHSDYSAASYATLQIDVSHAHYAVPAA